MVLPGELMLKIIEHSTIKEIKKICQSSPAMKNLCENNKKTITKSMLRALNEFIKAKNNEIIRFSVNNEYSYDKNTSRLSLQSHGRAIVYDKILIVLMYMISNKYYEEAEVLINLTDFTDMTPSFFLEPSLEKIPARLIKLIMNKFPDTLDLFGYISKEDFEDDFPLNVFANKTLQNILIGRGFF